MSSAPSTPVAASAAPAAVPDAPAAAHAFSADPLAHLEGKQISFSRDDSLLGKRILELNAEVRSLRRTLDQKESHIEYLVETCEDMEEKIQSLEADAESLKMPVRRILRSRLQCKSWIEHQMVKNSLQEERQRKCTNAYCRCCPPATGGAWSEVEDLDFFHKQEADVSLLQRFFVKNYDWAGYASESSDEDETLSESERREADRDLDRDDASEDEAAPDFLSAVREIDAQCDEIMANDESALACVASFDGHFSVVRKA